MSGRPRGPTRRTVLTGLAGTLAGAGPLGGLRPACAADARIAVVGAGLAGLTATWRLAQAGHRATLYEASTRLGGRCFSARGVFGPGVVVERGGEFIDSGHRAIRGLAAELGLALDDVRAAEPAGTGALYRFGDRPYGPADATADFAGLYPALRAQWLAATGARSLGSSPEARRLDRLNVADWVAGTVPGGRASRLGALIENALSEESAADPDRLTALDAVLTLADNSPGHFDLYYTGSDQRYRVRGGNDQIATGLGERLGAAVETGTALQAVRRLDDGRLRLVLARDGASREETFDRVVLALPFSVLRANVDLERAGFGETKLRAIRELGMGTSAKLQLGFRGRPWHALGCNGEVRPASPVFQTSWDATRSQDGPSGVLCFWGGGHAVAWPDGTPDPAGLARDTLAAAEAILPALAGAWDGKVLLDAWARNPYSLGSYSTFPPGYLTGPYGVEAQPEGRCFFAGEHTHAQSGYMNSAVASGNRAASEVLASLG